MTTDFLNEVKIRQIFEGLESKQLMPSSHLYKRFPDKYIGEAAEVFSNKYSDEAREKPALALLAVVLSIHRNYTKIVEPRTDRIRQTAFRTFVDLKEKAKDLGTFSDFCDMRAIEKYNIVIGVLAAIDKLKERSKETDDFEVLHKWAITADWRNYDEDIIGRIKGVGLATFQHLRMNFGADTVKPDQRVEEVLNREFGLQLKKDIENIDVVEYIAKVTGKSALYIDQVFVNYGSGYYVKEGMNQEFNGIIAHSHTKNMVKNHVSLKEQSEDSIKNLKHQQVLHEFKDGSKDIVNVRKEKRMIRKSLGDPDILLQTFKDYFLKRKISDLIIEEVPKAEKGKKNAHFFKHMNDGILQPFLYISPRGNLCMPVKNAQKLGLILDKDYETMKYSNPYRAVIINLKYYNNLSELLGKLIVLYK